MTVVLHLSDPHFGTERPAVVAAALRLAQAQAPGLVLLSGDITQRARTRQFQSARRFIDAIGAPVIAVPGNHDIPLFNLAARAAWPYAGYRRAFGADLEPRWSSEQIAVIGINTTRPWRHKHGELSAQQVEETAQWLRGTPPQALRIVMTHHPLLVTRDEDLINRPRVAGGAGHAAGATDAARAWSDAGADLLLAGHIHLPFFLPLAGVLPGLPRRTWALQAGTVVSKRVRPGAPPSLNIVRRGEAGNWSLERWNYGERRGEFVCVAVQGIERDGGKGEPDVRLA